MGSEKGKFHQNAISQLVRRLGCRAVSVGYRLAPEHPFPAAIHDVCSVIRELGAGGDPIILAGDSAGGNMALVAALGAKLTVLSKDQADYIGVPVEGPYKPNTYRY